MATRLANRFAACVAIALASAPVSAQPVAQQSDGDALLELVGRPWTGDLDGMIERGAVRILTAYTPIYFSYDGDAESGLAADIARELKARFVEWFGETGKPLTVSTIPVPRDELIPRLLEGRGDIVVANLTITPEREGVVQFSNPVGIGVRELVVTSKSVGPIQSLDDLVPYGVSLRKTSSYFEHLSAINADRQKTGVEPVPIDLRNEALEDHDVLELVNAGSIPATIVDSHQVQLWAQLLDGIMVNDTVSVNDDGVIAWAMRPDSPKLQEGVNRFVAEFKKGTLLGNILFKRYLGNPDWVANNLDDAGGEKTAQVVDLIREKADKYGFDWLMIVSQGYQESRLDQSKRSHVGAVGIMQVMPTTARDPVIAVPNIEEPEANVEAGVKYLNWLRETFFNDAAIAPADQVLFAFAAYNAGPGNIAKARARAEKMDLDPNVWFGNVEIATARAVSREPVIYVRNIMKYYVAYKRAQDIRLERGK